MQFCKRLILKWNVPKTKEMIGKYQYAILDTSRMLEPITIFYCLGYLLHLWHSTARTLTYTFNDLRWLKATITGAKGILAEQKDVYVQNGTKVHGAFTIWF